MGIEQMDYTAILADLEAKRAALDATIASFRQAMAMGALGQSGEVAASSNGGPPFSSSLGSEVPAGAFLGKSIPEAAKLYLAIVRKKQTSKEIGEALKRGGMESTSKNFIGIVHAVLDRARKANTGIVKLDRSNWGLADWYPAGLRSAVVVLDKHSARTARKKARKKKGIAKAPRVLTSAIAAPDKPAKTTNERILEFLRQADHAQTLEEIAEHIGTGTKGARLILGKLAKAGKVDKLPLGKYRIARPLLTTLTS